MYRCDNNTANGFSLKVWDTSRKYTLEYICNCTEKKLLKETVRLNQHGGRREPGRKGTKGGGRSTVGGTRGLGSGRNRGKKRNTEQKARRGGNQQKMAGTGINGNGKREV